MGLRLVTKMQGNKCQYGILARQEGSITPQELGEFRQRAQGENSKSAGIISVESRKLHDDHSTVVVITCTKAIPYDDFTQLVMRIVQKNFGVIKG